MSIFVKFLVIYEETGKFDVDPSYNTQEIETTIEIQDITYTTEGHEEVEIPISKELEEYIINIINYNNK